MDAKKLVVSAIAGFVVMFAISGLWYMVIMPDYYSEQFTEIQRPEVKMLWIAAGYLVWAFLMAYMYPIGYKGGSPVNEGLKFGILIGLIAVLPLNLILYAVYTTFPLPAALIDSVYQVVEKAIGGIVIGVVYGKITESTS